MCMGPLTIGQIWPIVKGPIRPDNSGLIGGVYMGNSASMVLDIMAGVGQLAILLVLAIVLFKIGKFVDALSEMVKKG